MLCKNSKIFPDETCPCRVVIYTQNVNELSRKYKQLESLLDPLLDIMILKEIMTYCLQETWVVGNTVIIVGRHMIFLHKICEMEERTKGSNTGGVAIIIALTAVVAWKEAGLNPPITTPLDSKFVGIFNGIKMPFPKVDKWEKRVLCFLKKLRHKFIIQLIIKNTGNSLRR